MLNSLYAYKYRKNNEKSIVCDYMYQLDKRKYTYYIYMFIVAVMLMLFLAFKSALQVVIKEGVGAALTKSGFFDVFTILLAGVVSKKISEKFIKPINKKFGNENTYIFDSFARDFAYINACLLLSTAGLLGKIEINSLEDSYYLCFTALTLGLSNFIDFDTDSNFLSKLLEAFIKLPILICFHFIFLLTLWMSSLGTYAGVPRYLLPKLLGMTLGGIMFILIQLYTERIKIADEVVKWSYINLLDQVKTIEDLERCLYDPDLEEVRNSEMFETLFDQAIDRILNTDERTE